MKGVTMANYRRGRVNEAMAKELMRILPTVKDPRVSTAFFSITSVDCTPDLKFAKVYYSTMGGKDGDEGVAKGLKSAVGYIRRELAQRLNLRITPELDFEYDDSAEKGARIESVLKDLGL